MAVDIARIVCMSCAQRQCYRKECTHGACMNPTWPLDIRHDALRREDHWTRPFQCYSFLVTTSIVWRGGGDVFDFGIAGSDFLISVLKGISLSVQLWTHPRREKNDGIKNMDLISKYRVCLSFVLPFFLFLSIQHWHRFVCKISQWKQYIINPLSCTTSSFPPNTTIFVIE